MMHQSQRNPSFEKSLYLLALVPPEELREEVRRLKEEMKVRFQASHALKVPAHITLQMPFWRTLPQLEKLEVYLEDFSIGQSPFEIDLSGFAAFPPRVIFIKIANPGPIEKIYRTLQEKVNEVLEISKPSRQLPFHPHMTIATRDLKESAFEQAWPEFSGRRFERSFTAKSLFLLRHNGKFWEWFREYPFKTLPGIKPQ
ncbi:2'-5' RNA ligase family protein [Robiginitalea sp. IMCC44478]|uniref:2'-5' RNA ligase family protein n=1 Tax=Robiginitalea sp. IMCC44478 TaxID=3459122 RepID=UPI0040412A27